MSRRALITGITGQDGYYLAELLLREGYAVVGALRPRPEHDFTRLAPLIDRVEMIEADLTDADDTLRLVERAAPDEIYNLAGRSFVPDSWDFPLETGDVMTLGVVRLLESIRRLNPRIRFCQAGSSEMFGQVEVEPQNESTPCFPRTPYGVAKAAAYWTTGNYRRHHGLFACTAIAYNHESPLRNVRFVTRKVTDAVARIQLGRQSQLTLGNLDAQRDWSFAGDVVRGMWLMLQRDEPADYILASGVKHSVRTLVETAFAHVGLDWRQHVVVDPTLLRPEDPMTLRGDPGKARRELHWQPTLTFEQLIHAMVDADLVRQHSDIGCQNSRRDATA